MSDTQQEESDLLAGHPPAVKAGGMRIVQHKHEKGDGSQSREEKKEQEEEFGTVDVKSDKHHQSLLLSGAVTKGDKDFPPEAVKSYHEKPQPTHDNRPPTSTMPSSSPGEQGSRVPAPPRTAGRLGSGIGPQKKIFPKKF